MRSSGQGNHRGGGSEAGKSLRVQGQAGTCDEHRCGQGVTEGWERGWTVSGITGPSRVEEEEEKTSEGFRQGMTGADVHVKPRAWLP